MPALLGRAIGPGRRQPRGHAVGRPGGPGTRHPGRRRGDLQARADGTALRFKLNLANLDNAVAAHIHCGAVGVNGPIGVTLFMGPPAGGRVNGTLAEGPSLPPIPPTAAAGST